MMSSSGRFPGMTCEEPAICVHLPALLGLQDFQATSAGKGRLGRGC